MSIILGSINLTRFSVEGPLPDHYMEEFPGRIARHAFRKLREDSTEERAVGWVNIMEMLDSEFGGKEFFKDPYIAMSWRVDERKVPGKALKLHLREAELEIKRAENVQYLSKARLQEIKERVRLQLLRRTIPNSSVYDMVWHLPLGVVIFGSVSSRLCDEFAEFFFKTFDLRLHSIFPYSLAHKCLEDDGVGTDLLDDLYPLSFQTEKW